MAKLVELKDEVEHIIWWQIKGETNSFWCDNWTQQGALYFIEEGVHDESDIEVKNFIREGGWKVKLLREHISKEMMTHIIDNIKSMVTLQGDNPC